MSKNAQRIALQYQHYVPRIAALLATVCAGAALLYGVFLLEAVAHAAGRESAERHIVTISSNVSGLEATYLSDSQAITPQTSAALGFVNPTEVTEVDALQAPALTLR